MPLSPKGKKRKKSELDFDELEKSSLLLLLDLLSSPSLFFFYTRVSFFGWVGGEVRMGCGVS